MDEEAKNKALVSIHTSDYEMAGKVVYCRYESCKLLSLSTFEYCNVHKCCRKQCDKPRATLKSDSTKFRELCQDHITIKNRKSKQIAVEKIRIHNGKRKRAIDESSETEVDENFEESKKVSARNLIIDKYNGALTSLTRYGNALLDETEHCTSCDWKIKYEDLQKRYDAMVKRNAIVAASLTAE